MDKTEAVLEGLEIDGDLIRITATVDKKRLVKEAFDDILDYSLKNQVKDKILPHVVADILENHKDEIVKKVLLEVNWTEIVRSEVAQQVIKQISSGRSY